MTLREGRLASDRVGGRRATRSANARTYPQRRKSRYMNRGSLCPPHHALEPLIETFFRDQPRAAINRPHPSTLCPAGRPPGTFRDLHGKDYSRGSVCSGDSAKRGMPMARAKPVPTAEDYSAKDYSKWRASVVLLVVAWTRTAAAVGPFVFGNSRMS